MPPSWAALLGKSGALRGLAVGGAVLYLHERRSGGRHVGGDGSGGGGGGSSGHAQAQALQEEGQRMAERTISGAAAGSWLHRHRPRGVRGEEDEVVHGLIGMVGNTPLVELRSLSEATGCRILCKAEHLNPSGSVKDRAAVYMIMDAERKGLLKPGHGVIVEGTGGNTGIGLALAGLARGYECILTVPEDVAPEKIALMEAYGAEVHVQPSVPFSDPRHYYHRAAAIAAELREAQEARRVAFRLQHHALVEGDEKTIYHPNQFENLANFKAHFETTGPEIYRQTRGHVDAFVCAAGTGGTLGGVSVYLKQKLPHLKVFLADPPGSSLANYLRSGQLQPTPGSSITEGIGIGRLTNNFRAAAVDGCFTISDQETVDMAFYLLETEGLFVGPSAALNVVGAVKAARALGPGHTVVTILCDGGERYLSKTYKDDYLTARGLRSPGAEEAEDGGAIGTLQPVIDGVRLPSQVMRLTRERELEEELGLADARDRRTRIGRQEL